MRRQSRNCEKLLINAVSAAPKMNLRANCRIRGSFLVEVTTPKFGLPNVLLGVLKIGEFVKLNDSARNSKPAVSVTGNLRKREKSRFFVASDRREFLPRVPKVYG